MNYYEANQVEYEVAADYAMVKKIAPDELGRKVAEFVTHFLTGFGDVSLPDDVSLRVEDVTIGLALTAEANLRVVSAGATASFQLRLTPVS